MRFKNCYGHSFEMNEGNLVKIRFDEETDGYDMLGVVVLSLGIVLGSDGWYCPLTDILSIEEYIGPASTNQLKDMFENFDVNDLYIFDEDIEIAEKYIKTSNPSLDLILPLGYKEDLFKDKESLLKFVKSC